jgi:hypothetical protein
MSPRNVERSRPTPQSGAEPQEAADVAELRALVPAPPAARLAPARRAELEDNLLGQIEPPTTTAASAADHPLITRRRVGRRSLSLAAAAAVVATAAAVFAVTGSNSQTAVAAPAPLHIEASRPTVPLATVAKRAAALADSPAAPHSGPHFREWALGLWDDGKHQPEVVPVQEYHYVWHADGSGELETTKNGQVTRQHMPAGTREKQSSFQPAPPTTAHAFGDYLAKENPDTRTSGYWTLDAVQSRLLNEWTLSPAQTAALVELLAQHPDIHALGPVRDRAGRQGQAYGVDFKGAVRQTVILDEHTGRVLGTELSSIRTDAKMLLKPGDVEQYDTYLD